MAILPRLKVTSNIASINPNAAMTDDNGTEAIFDDVSVLTEAIFDDVSVLTEAKS